MDRFIVTNLAGMTIAFENLKSNMDRFIEESFLQPMMFIPI